MILVLGKSSIATQLSNELDHVVVIGRPEYDFSREEDCDRAVETYNPDVVINTFALNQEQNLWDILLVNFVATACLTHKFYEKLDNKQIINISSASTHWVSFPDIHTGRLFYSMSKECVSNFGKHYNRKINDSRKNTVSTIEIPRFASKFNDYNPGIEHYKIVQAIKNCIDNKYTSVTILE
jgi:NAD(P)-dependent dehydrogenase (short-subunit alcohol dehydrogenase family)